MLAGMGTVFAFLTALVAAMTLASWLVSRTRRDPGEVSDEEVAAISAAITRHRSGQQ
jgi:Na+-transporting methylmalonyl-CoA/oxaloacetate decarboxylase gamma subunit